MLLIAAPQTGLLKTVAPKTTARDRDIAFLRRKLIAAAAKYANAVVIPFNDMQRNAPAYGDLAQAAALQADQVHPGIELMDALSVAGSAPAPESTLAASVAAADPNVSGYALTDPGGAGDPAAVGLLTDVYGPAG